MSIQRVEDAQNDALGKPSVVQLSGPRNSDAPITRLPNEILAQIFHQGVSSEEDGGTFRSSIFLVMRHWREVGINTSSLWTHLVIGPHHTPEFVEMYLDRSKERPLAIHLAYLSSPKNLHPILPLLTLSAYRWRELIIEHDDDECLLLILQSLRDLEAPLLETMSVAVWYMRTEAVVNHIFSRGAPRLSSLYMRGIGRRGCWPPTENVTTFHISFDPPYGLRGIELYEMLEALPSVTTLFLPTPSSIFISGDVSRKLTMFSLRRLIIDATGHRADIYLECLLAEMISAPNLETLVIEGVSYEDMIYSFSSLATPPLKFPALTSLELRRLPFHGMTRGFFRSLPNVKELVLIQCFSDDYALRLLLDEEGGSLLFPRLQTLTFGTSTTAEDHILVGLLCDIVTTRARLEIPIQRLGLDSHLYTTMDPERMEWLQGHVQLDIHDFEKPWWR